MKNKAKKAVSKAMREKAEEALTELQYCQNGMFRLVKRLKTNSKDVDGGRCMIGSYGKQCFSEMERGKVWKDYMERIMNEENDWGHHNVEGDEVEGPVVCVSREEVLQALNKMKTVKAPGPSEVSLVLIAASRGVKIQVMVELCQIVLDGFGTPTEWALSIVDPIFMGKGDIRNCNRYGSVMLLEHGMKVVERVVKKRLHRIVTVDDMQFGFVPERGTTDAVFIL